jgi:NAD(P)-dependent dehydrogenase (short-subunit alcohol dehydrogenase family)
MPRSYVVTGGRPGVARAIVERLAREGRVVLVERDPEALAWAQPVDGGRSVLGLDPEARDGG